ncbi:hypothetical protein STXM2123_1759 [Streptomyces sp. F-3]|nr:hypothetical protein STXM2123_1759 [Streptomyces sp. F-3]
MAPVRRHSGAPGRERGRPVRRSRARSVLRTPHMDITVGPFRPARDVRCATWWNHRPDPERFWGYTYT